MKTLEQYNIPFSGLKPGTHIFDFSIDGNFFKQFEYPEIRDGLVAVTVTMEKEERLFDLHFHLKGEVMVPCDRCNEMIWIPIDGTQRLLVKLGEGYLEESEDVQVIPETDGKIELANFFYEYIVLMLPAKRVHADDENGVSLCDPEIIKRLSQPTDHHEPDPRWEILNKLKNNTIN